jgi:phage terminase small subunit
MNLTQRQAKFVDEYVLRGNAAAAARAAGYSADSAKVTACRMLTKANLQAAIAAKKQAVAEEIELRRENIIAAILKAIEMARKQEEPATMVSGLKEIAKLCGFYEQDSLAEQVLESVDGRHDWRVVTTSKLAHQLADGGPMSAGEIRAFFSTLSAEELMAIADGRARVVAKVAWNEPATIRTADGGVR